MAYLDKTGTGQDISVESVIITIGYIIDATLHIVARPELHFEQTDFVFQFQAYIGNSKWFLD